jgi:hypothetical protein
VKWLERVAAALVLVALFAVGQVLADNGTRSPSPSRLGMTAADVFRRQGLYSPKESYGAKVNGTTDDSAALQAAVTAACTKHGTVALGPGVYRVTTMIDVNNCDSITIAGVGHGLTSGAAATVLKWAGASGGTVLRVKSTRWSNFKDFTIEGNALAGRGIDYTATNAIGTSQQNHFTNITLRGVTGSPGVAVHVGSTANDQVSESSFEGMAIFDSPTAIVQDGAQTIDINYMRSLISAYTSIGMDIAGGSVTTFNLDFENGTASTTDVRVQNGAGRVVFVDNYHEDTAGATQKAFDFPSGSRTYATTFLGGEVLYTSTAGGTVVNYQQQGPVAMVGMQFMSNAANQGGTISFAGPGPSANDVSLPGTVFYNSNRLAVSGSSRAIGPLSSSVAAADTAGVPVSYRGGNGGTASATGGGAGGLMSVLAPNGGDGTAGLAAGAGAPLLLQSGPPGVNNGGGGASPGDVRLNVPSPTGAAAAGRIRIQDNGTNVIGIIPSTKIIYPESNGTGSLGTAGSVFAEVQAKKHVFVSQTVAAASSTTITSSSGNHVRLTLGTNITTLALAAGAGGEILMIELIQDATGGRTLPASWTNTAFAGGAYTVTATANKRDVLQFVYDATDSKWYERSRSQNQ